jgi:hypothetical protein
VNRRRLLGIVGLVGVGGLAGCTGSGPGTEPTETPSPTPTEPPQPEPIVVTDADLEVLRVDCGTTDGRASIAHEVTGGQRGRLTVMGIIGGRDTCYRARLGQVSFDGAGVRLTIPVVAFLPDSSTDRACSECLVDVEYRATVAYEGAGPFSVVVEHDGDAVASVDGLSPVDGTD